ncbi:MAG: KGK domain-containing protein [Phormidesmis sp.]
MNVCLAFSPEQSIAASETAKTSYQSLDKDLLKTQDNVGKLWRSGCELIYELKDRLRTTLGIQDAAYSKYFWLDRGIECEVLQTTSRTSGWQSGLVRLQIIFVPKDIIADPEEPASENSALESLRQPV